MSSPRKLLVLALLGFLTGAIAGIGALILRSRGIAVPLIIRAPDLTRDGSVSGFTASCTGGSAPTVNLSWIGGDGGVLATIERSVSGGAWMAVGTVDSDVRVFHDSGIVADTLYAYRLTFANVPATPEISIETSGALCPLH